MNTASTAVVAIMITGKTVVRYPLALCSVAAFENQAYAGPRQLLIVNDSPIPLFPDGTPPFVQELHIPQEPRTLGELRNIAINHASSLGDYLVQWDDDDYSHPGRLAWQVTNTPAGDASIFRWEIHQDLATGEAFANNGRQSRVQGFAGTMLWPASSVVRFPAKGRHEDTEFLLQLRRTTQLHVLENPPCFYVRGYHGNNTWSRKHVMQRKPGSRNLTLTEQSYVQSLREGPLKTVAGINGNVLR